MKSLRTLFIIFVALVGICSCSQKKTVFVLLPDPDGHVGAIEVTTKGGTQVVNKAGHATQVVQAEEQPTAPSPISDEQIEKVFGAALRAQPEPPLRFLIYFESGNSELTDESRKTLKEAVAAIQQQKSGDISVIGHTDRAGSDTYNEQLSLKRAGRIKDILGSLGIDTGIVSVDSHGEGNPLIATPDGVVEPRNRRVEIIVR